MYAKHLTLFLAICLFVHHASGHGRVMDPPNRSTMWRNGFPNEPNYTDMGINCGGFDAQYKQNGGKCGICGDNFADPTPRANEDGGLYGKGIVVKKYKRGGKVPVHVELTQEHLGYFEFGLCNLSKGKESDACFKVVPLVGGAKRYRVKGSGKYTNHRMTVQLPKGVKCKRCVLRWTYRGGNNFGTCKNGTKKLGCGPQETFRNCVDIAIL